MKNNDETFQNNIVFIMVDQLSDKWLNIALNGACDLPNIKWLKENGTTFSNAFCENPVCSPARATIATGLSSRGHGVIENGYILDPNIPTFMQQLQKTGYRTGAFGKLHFIPHYKGFYEDYKSYGFDVTHITEDGRGGEWLDWIEKNYTEHFDNVLATIWAPNIPEFERYGERKIDLRKRIEIAKEKMYWKNDRYPENSSLNYILPFPKEISQTEWITQKSLEFLGKIEDGNPFFTHISYVQPHSPYNAPQEYLDKVDMDKVPKPLPATWEGDPVSPKCFENRKNTDSRARYMRNCYFADLIHLDEQIGKILNKLREMKRLDNTYIFFTSDHGDLLGDHGFMGKEERHYDACIHVPLIISGPLFEKGAIKNNIVQHCDLCPTILDIANTRMPSPPKMGEYLKMNAVDIDTIRGKSLILLSKEEEKENWRESAYCESYNRISSNNPQDWARTVRTDTYRYTYYPMGGGEQLFDLQKDPNEQMNLADDLD